MKPVARPAAPGRAPREVPAGRERRHGRHRRLGHAAGQADRSFRVRRRVAMWYGKGPAWTAAAMCSST
jgi:hypothetical protein